MKRVHTVVSIFAAAAVLAPAGKALARKPVFHHHRADHEGEEQDHKSNRSAKPAKGTATGLTLQSRALLDKAGNTEVEISTAPFDIGASAPGNITEVDLRAVDPRRRGDDDDDHDGKDGKRLRFHKEYDHLRQGGYVHWSYPGLPHGQALRIKAEARASAHGRETEARWLDYVRYRPDLAVKMVDAPGLAPVNTLVTITGAVVEQMGELGAHADCVLLMDGVQVDTMGAPIWVDAAGTAGCRFTYAFKSAGLHSLTVKLQNVHPGDYDDSNNSFTRQIQIQSAATLYYEMSAMDQVTTSITTTDSYYTSTSVTPEEHKVETSNQRVQNRTFSGSIPAAIGDVKRIAFNDSSGSKGLSSFSIDQAVFDKIVPVDGNCDPSTTNETMFNDFTVPGRSVTLVRCFNANTSAGATLVSVTFDAFDGTFLSVNTCTTLMLGCQPGDSVSGPAEGTIVDLGDDYTADFTLEDGSVYTAHPTMPLVLVPGTSTTPVVSSPLSCVEGPDLFKAGTTGKKCQQTVKIQYVKNGDVQVLAPATASN
jgi:hypothetical protein